MANEEQHPNKYISSGIKAERLEPHSSNLISLHMNIAVCIKNVNIVEKKIVMDIFQLKRAFRYVLQGKHITLVDDFILLFPTLHFYAQFDSEGQIEKAIPTSPVLSGKSIK